MDAVFALSAAALLAWLAWRAIRGRRPQSESLHDYGIFALILLLAVAVKALDCSPEQDA